MSIFTDRSTALAFATLLLLPLFGSGQLADGLEPWQDPAVRIVGLDLRTFDNKSRLVVTLSEPLEQDAVAGGDANDVLREVRLPQVTLGDFETPPLSDNRIKSVKLLEENGDLLLQVELPQKASRIIPFKLKAPPTVIVDFYGKASAPPLTTPPPVKTKTPITIRSTSDTIEAVKTPVGNLMLPPVRVTPAPTSAPLIIENPTTSTEDFPGFGRLDEFLLKEATARPSPLSRARAFLAQNEHQQVIDSATAWIGGLDPTASPAAGLIILAETYADRYRLDQKKSNLRLALDLHHLLLRRCPDDELAPLILARSVQLHQQLNENPEAMGAMDWLKAFGPSSWDATILNYFGELLLESGEWRTARDTFFELFSRFPQLPQGHRARFQIAYCHYRLGRFPDAYTAFYEGLKDNPQIVEEDEKLLAAWGQTAYKHEMFEPAKTAFHLFENRFPDSPLLAEVMVTHADALRLNGEEEAAFLQNLEVSKLFPELEQGVEAVIRVCDLAFEHLLTNGYSPHIYDHPAYLDPEQALMEIIDSSPFMEKRQIAGRVLAEYYYEKGMKNDDPKDLTTSIETVAYTLKQTPDLINENRDQLLAFFRDNISYFLSAAAQEDNAEGIVQIFDDFPEIRDVAHDDPQLGYTLLEAYHQLHSNQNILELAEKILARLELEEEDEGLTEKVLFTKGATLARLQDTNEAIVIFEQLLSDYTTSTQRSSYFHQRGLLAKAQNDQDLTRQMFDNAIASAQKSDLELARVFLDKGDLHFSQEQWLDAKSSYIRAFRVLEQLSLTLDLELAENLLFNLAHARYQAKDYEDARITLEEYLKLYAGAEQANFAKYLLAHCHVELMINTTLNAQLHYERAKQLFEELLALSPEELPDLRDAVSTDLNNLESQYQLIDRS